MMDSLQTSDQDITQRGFDKIKDCILACGQ